MFFSIIVPVYKTEDYLCKCVDSIIGQSFRDFELILVDDGSPDNCGELCDRYAAADERVTVIHQKNAGPSAARNAGLKKMGGNTFFSQTAMTGQSRTGWRRYIKFCPLTRSM